MSLLRILLLLAALGLLLLPLAAFADAQPDPERPLWQSSVPGMPIGAGLRIGGTWRRVEWPQPPSLTPEQIAAQQAADLARIETVARGNLMSRGLALVSVGVLLLMVGAVMHAVNRSTIVQRVTEWAMAIGAGLLVSGLLHWWVYTAYRWLMAGVTVTVLLGLAAGLYRLRHWGIIGRTS